MRPLLLVGFGDAASALARVAREEGSGRPIVGTTRDRAKFPELSAQGVSPLHFSSDPVFETELTQEARDADVFVSFPPDASADALVARACAHARSLVYVSSTGVYARNAGDVDARTAAAPDSAAGIARLAAEEVYRAAGGIILRAPALYGLTSGLHVRLAAGTYRLPGDGSGTVSRLHLDDLAGFALAAFERGVRGATYLLGDASPAANRDVVAYVCELLALPFPPSVPLADAPLTLRGSRSVDASAALTDLRVALRFPTYREGYANIAAAARPDRPPT